MIAKGIQRAVEGACKELVELFGEYRKLTFDVGDDEVVVIREEMAQWTARSP